MNASIPKAVMTPKAAEALFTDYFAIQDAAAIGKRFIVAFPSATREGLLVKHGTYWTEAEAQTALVNLPNTRGITTGRLVVLQPEAAVEDDAI